MKKFKKVISLILTVALLCSTLLSSGMIAYASLLPLKEKNAYLVLGDHKDLDISAVPLELILDSLMDSEGNPVEIDRNAKIAWCYCKDRDGSTITDDYFRIGAGDCVDLSVFDEVNNYIFEMIVGSGTQLNPNNIRYNVRIYMSDQVSAQRTFELYTQDADGTRHKVVPSDSYATDLMLGSLNTTRREFIVPEHTKGTEYYLSINDTADKHPYIKTVVMSLSEYQNFLLNGSNYEYTDLNDKMLNTDMTKTDAGYKGTWERFDLQNPNAIINNGFAILYLDYKTKEILSSTIEFFFVSDKTENFEDTAFDLTGTESVKLESTSHVKPYDLNGNNTLDNEDIIFIQRVILKKGYSADEEYLYCLYPKIPKWENANDHVVKAVFGWELTLESAADKEDISDILLPKSNYTGPKGYKANYNIQKQGVPFSVFFDDGSSYRLFVIFDNYDTNADWEYVRDFNDKPIIGEADPWIRVTGASDSEGNKYDTYTIENGKNINMDTYYGYGYETVFINDSNADLSKLAPEFWFANTKRVYAVSADTGNRVQENHTRDFTEKNQQYTGIIINSDGKENERNYWVTFRKLNNSGPELFVYGPHEREVILDEYFEFKHDILIANIGNSPLEDISVELHDAKNVKLDPYWTVGGQDNSTLAAFSTTSSNTKYGELPNLAKIRLLPDGEGEVKGTLIIKAKGQTPFIIELNGKAMEPEIITDTLDDAVKYVPYQHIIATNNMHDWITTNFSITKGQLPDGITLNSETGEIYGVPTVPENIPEEVYKFTMRAEYTVDGQGGYFRPSEKEFSITVKSNTDKNVYLATDSSKGYVIETPIGIEEGQYHFVLDSVTDTLFVSKGSFNEFKYLWLNGEKLVEDVDYTKEEGSTRITIKSQTFNDRINDDTTNTIAMEFRKDNTGDGKGDDGAEMNRTSQNFVIKKNPPADSVVDKVIAIINTIPANITLNDKNTVVSARNAYNNLSSQDKAKVTNYDKLTAAEKEIANLEKYAADKAAADIVIEKIRLIPSVINYSSENAIKEARSSYDNLSQTQKNLVVNYERLQNAEQALELYKQMQSDKARAAETVKLITAIPAQIDLNAKATIEAARTSYNSLTSTQMTYVSNYDRLIKAEEALAKYIQQQEQAEKDKAAAEKVIDLISKLPDKVSLNDKTAVNAARNAYNGLTASQKSYVKNYNKLTADEEEITELETEENKKAEINSVITAIDNLPEKITLDDKEQVKAARALYEKLDSEQKEQVVNFEKLVNAENTIKALELQNEADSKDKTAAEKVISIIDKLPGKISAENREAVENARKAYDSLTEKQKTYITNYAVLTNAEAVLKALDDYENSAKKDRIAADKVIKLIAELPENIKLEDKPAVEKARTEYNNLTDNQKEIITNYKVLTDAEVIIAKLEDDEYENNEYVTFIGVLVDADGKAYADKTVEIHSEIKTGITDKNGSFRFNEVEFGKHKLTVKDKNSNIIAEKDFNIVSGVGLALNGNEITADKNAVFTLNMEIDNNEIVFLNISEGNKAPVVYPDEDNNGSIDIGDDNTPPPVDDKNDGIDIGENTTRPDSNKENHNLTPQPNPNTGDSVNINFWIAVLIISLTCLTVTLYKGKKKRII